MPGRNCEMKPPALAGSATLKALVARIMTAGGRADEERPTKTEKACTRLCLAG